MQNSNQENKRYLSSLSTKKKQIDTHLFNIGALLMVTS